MILYRGTFTPDFVRVELFRKDSKIIKETEKFDALNEVGEDGRGLEGLKAIKGWIGSEE